MNVYQVATLSITRSEHIDPILRKVNVLANSIPNAIEVAEQHLAKGHDPISSVTLVCEDVKVNRNSTPSRPHMLDLLESRMANEGIPGTAEEYLAKKEPNESST